MYNNDVFLYIFMRKGLKIEITLLALELYTKEQRNRLPGNIAEKYINISDWSMIVAIVMQTAFAPML